MRLSLAAGLAKGMAELYNHVPAIQHRDLKSMNVLVSANWEAKVSDFGLARHRSETSQATSVRAKGGTFRWAAPETFDSHFNEASDVYSCGITLWELCTRELPYGDMPDQASWPPSRPCTPARSCPPGSPTPGSTGREKGSD